MTDKHKMMFKPITNEIIVLKGAYQYLQQASRSIPNACVTWDDAMQILATLIDNREKADGKD